MKRIHEVLEKFPDYRIIPYAPDLVCQEGDMAFGEKGRLVGYCETNIGHMLVCECPRCSKKYRFHASGHWDDTLEEFDDALEDKIYTDTFHPLYFCNSLELAKKINMDVS